jgi:hypothetical protein
MSAQLRELFAERAEQAAASTVDDFRSGVAKKISRTRRRRWLGGTAAALVLVVGLTFAVSYRAAPGPHPSNPGPNLSTGPTSSPATRTASQRRADELLADWAEKVSTKSGHPLVVTIGDLAFENRVSGHGGNTPLDVIKAGRQGHMILPSRLRVTVPDSVTVTWPDGSSRVVAAARPRAAIDAMAAEFEADWGPCPRCLMVHVTAVRLVDGEILTSRGPARVPLWEFTVEGSPGERPTYPAIDLNDPGVIRTGQPTGPGVWNRDEPTAIASRRATVDATMSEITVQYLDPSTIGNQRCPAAVAATAVESPTGVVLIVTSHGCAERARNTTTVRLSRPLGDRVLIDVVTGGPIPVTVS